MSDLNKNLIVRLPVAYKSQQIVSSFQSFSSGIMTNLSQLSVKDIKLSKILFIVRVLNKWTNPVPTPITRRSS
jgi:hypothetical protein